MDADDGDSFDIVDTPEKRALKARLIEKGRSSEEAAKHVTRVLDWDSENPHATVPLAAALIDSDLTHLAQPRLGS